MEQAEQQVSMVIMEASANNLLFLGDEEESPAERFNTSSLH
jgi:hypothetical protein